MERRERVLAALQGQRVDRVPFAMWQHFYLQSETAEGLARSTIEFCRRTRPDLAVLAPSPLYMVEAWGADVRSFSSDDLAPYLANAFVTRPTDWRRLPELEVMTGSLRREIDALRQVREQLGSDAPLIVLLYSPLTTADTLCDGRIIEDMRSFTNDVRSGLRTIAAVTRAFALACIQAGADGYLYCVQSAIRGQLRAREQHDVQRLDLEVLDALSSSPIRILFLEGKHPDLGLADRYPVQAVCWETWRADPSMASARRQIRQSLMGGINPMTFSGGSVADIQAQIQAAIAQTDGRQLVIAPTGPLPARSREELAVAVSSVIEEV
jgi:uroporphyrinogen decarboxylase